MLGIPTASFSSFRYASALIPSSLMMNQPNGHTMSATIVMTAMRPVDSDWASQHWYSSASPAGELHMSGWHCLALPPSRRNEPRPGLSLSNSPAGDGGVVLGGGGGGDGAAGGTLGHFTGLQNIMTSSDFGAVWRGKRQQGKGGVKRRSLSVGHCKFSVHRK